MVTLKVIEKQMHFFFLKGVWLYWEHKSMGIDSGQKAGRILLVSSLELNDLYSEYLKKRKSQLR